MPVDNNVNIILRVRNNMRNGLRGAARSLNRFAVGAQRAGLAMGTGAALMGAGLGKVVGLSTRLDDNMRQVAARVGNMDDATLKGLTDQAKELGRTTSFTTNEVAELMAKLAQGGKGSDEIKNLTPAMLDFAKATGISTEEAAQFSQQAMASFKISAEDATRVTDVLTVAANNSFQGVEDLGEALTQAGSIANATGQSFESTIANLSLLADSGIRGGRAGTGLKNVLTRLAGDGGKVLTDLGVKVKDLDGNIRPLPALLHDFGRATKDMGNKEKLEQFNDAFGKIGLNAGLLLSDGGAKLDEMMKKFDLAGGAAKRTADLMDAGPGGAFRRLWSAVEGFALAIGESVTPIIANLARWLTDLTNFITPLIDQFKGLGVYIVGVFGFLAGGAAILLTLAGGATVVASALAALSGIFTAILTVASGVMTALTAMAATFFSWPALIVAVVYALGEMLGVWKSVGNWFGNAWKTITSNVVTSWESIIDAIKTGDFELAFEIALKSAQVSMFGIMDDMWKGWRTWLGNLVSGISVTAMTIRTIWADAVGWIVDLLIQAGALIGVISEETADAMIAAAKEGRDKSAAEFAKWSADINNAINEPLGQNLDDLKAELEKLKNEAKDALDKMNEKPKETLWERLQRQAREAGAEAIRLAKAAARAARDLIADNFKTETIEFEVTKGALTGTSAASLQSQLAKSSLDLQKDQLTELQTQTTHLMRMADGSWGTFTP